MIHSALCSNTLCVLHAGSTNLKFFPSCLTDSAGVVVIVLPVIAGVLVLATVILVVVVLVFICWRRGSEVAYLTSEKDYEMSPPSSSPDIEKHKFSDVSFEPSTKEKH